MVFKDFLTAITGCCDTAENEEIRSMIGKLNILADPEDLSREEYTNVHNEVLGDQFRAYDRKDINSMLDDMIGRSTPILPEEIQELNSGQRNDLVEDAIDIANQYREVCLAFGLSDAIHTMTDQRIPSLAIMDNVPVNPLQYGLMSTYDDSRTESFSTGDDEENITVYDDDDDDDDDSSDPYYDGD